MLPEDYRSIAGLMFLNEFQFLEDEIFDETFDFLTKLLSFYAFAKKKLPKFIFVEVFDETFFLPFLTQLLFSFTFFYEAFCLNIILKQKLWTQLRFQLGYYQCVNSTQLVQLLVRPTFFNMFDFVDSTKIGQHLVRQPRLK